MDKMICGHERDVLRFAINAATPANKNPTTYSVANWQFVHDRYCRRYMHRNLRTGMIQCGAMRSDPEGLRLANVRADAWFAIHDPAKLAAMMAEELRRFGYILPPPPRNNHPEPECPSGGFRVKGLVPHGFESRIDIEWRLSSGRESRVLFMPEARRILLKWLQLPDGAREEAERALRGAT